MRTSLDKPLKPLRFLTERGRVDGVEVLLPHAWAVTDPFAGL